MASLQKKGDLWHCQFLHKKQRRTWVIGKVDDAETHAIKGKVEYLLMRVKQHLIDVPAGMDILDFIQCDGKALNNYHPPVREETTFAGLRDAYLGTHGNGTVEQNTLDTCQ